MEILLSRARNEIINLRKQNEILAAKVSVIDVFAAALGLMPRNQGAEIDIAWELEKKIKEIQEPHGPIQETY